MSVKVSGNCVIVMLGIYIICRRQRCLCVVVSLCTSRVGSWMDRHLEGIVMEEKQPLGTSTKVECINRPVFGLPPKISQCRSD